MGAAVTEAARRNRLGVIREMAAYVGEVVVAELRGTITRSQANKLHTFAAKATVTLTR